MATRSEAKRKAAAVCSKRRADCEILLDHLEELLAGNREENDWSEAGSLGHLKGILANAVSFYGGLDTEDIDEVLAELRGEEG